MLYRSISFIAAILALCLVVSMGYLFAWKSDQVDFVWLNPENADVPFMPDSCRWNNFVLVKKTTSGQVLYRCGPGIGYFVIWPFITTWTGPWPRAN